MTAWAGISAPALAAPAITLSPAAGPPTSDLVVSGTGFGATELVDVVFDGQTLLRLSTNAEGQFGPARRGVPAWAAPGEHFVSGHGLRTGTSATERFVVRTEWQQEGRTGLHTGFNPFENQLDAFNADDLGVAWSAPTDGPPATPSAEGPSPVVADGSVFVGSHATDRLFAFDAATGATRWAIRTFSRVVGSPVVSGGQVIVATREGAVRAYSIATRQRLWSAVIGEPEPAAITVRGDRLYVVGGGKLSVFAAGCATDGRRCPVLWSGDVPRGGGEPTAPAVDSRNVVVSSRGRLYGFGLNCATRTCAPRWIGETGQTLPIRAPAAIAGGSAYAGDDGGRLYAFPLRCGGEPSCGPAWRSGPGGIVGSTPVVGQGFVYVPSRTEGLRAFDAAACAKSGGVCAPAWIGTASGGHFSAVATPYLVFALQAPGRLVAYSPFCNSGGRTCTPAVDVALPAGANTLPVVVDGRVYVHATDGELHMLDRSDAIGLLGAT